MYAERLSLTSMVLPSLRSSQLHELTPDMVGVMAELARVLKEASVSIFTISTW